MSVFIMNLNPQGHAFLVMSGITIVFTNKYAFNCQMVIVKFWFVKKIVMNQTKKHDEGLNVGSGCFSSALFPKSKICDMLIAAKNY